MNAGLPWLSTACRSWHASQLPAISFANPNGFKYRDKRKTKAHPDLSRWAPSLYLLFCFHCFPLLRPRAHFERQLSVIAHADHHVVAVQHFAIEDLQRQRILDQLLDRPLQRTRAIRWIVPLREDHVLRRIAQLQADPPVR